MVFEIFVAIVVVLIIWAILIYNRFIKSRNVVKESWSGIDVQLKRRANLIPNLVETVKGYAKHERDAFKEVTELRSGTGLSVKERGRQESIISKAIGGIMAIAEDYPDLKANQNFLELQKNLNEVEEQIQHSRRYYNGSVRDWNVLVESFPSMIIASFCHFTLAEFFEIENPDERNVPEVKF